MRFKERGKERACNKYIHCTLSIREKEVVEQVLERKVEHLVQHFNFIKEDTDFFPRGKQLLKGKAQI